MQALLTWYHIVLHYLAMTWVGTQERVQPSSSRPKHSEASSSAFQKVSSCSSAKPHWALLKKNETWVVCRGLTQSPQTHRRHRYPTLRCILHDNMTFMQSVEFPSWNIYQPDSYALICVLSLDYPHLHGGCQWTSRWSFGCPAHIFIVLVKTHTSSHFRVLFNSTA